MKARMAQTTRVLTHFSKSYWIAGIGISVSCSVMHAQENLFRIASAQVPAASVVPLPGTQKEADDKSGEKKASNSSEDVIRFKAEQSPDKDAKDKEANEKESNDKEVKEKEVKEKEAKEKEAKEKANTKDVSPLVVPKLTVPNTSIQDVATGSTPEDKTSGRMPGAVPLPHGSNRYGYWHLDKKTWVPPVFCHQPVYFEETMLERHGHERFPCIQPLISGATFFSNIAFMPYHSYLHPPLEERYNTGNYRPGSAAPALRQRAPYDAGALRFQLLTTGTTVLAVQP